MLTREKKYKHTYSKFIFRKKVVKVINRIQHN